VSFFEDEEEDQIFEEETEVKRGGPRRKPPGQSPLVRVVIILVAVILLVLVTSLGIRSCLENRKENEYRDYFGSVESLLVESDAIGSELSAVLQQPDENVRQQLETKLAEFQSSQEDITRRASEIEAPDTFKEENTWFVAAMQMRARGLEGLRPALLNAIEAKDNQLGASQVAYELLILLASDVVYEVNFFEPAQRELQEDDITDIKVPQTKFLEPALAGQQTLVTVLERLKGGAEQVTGLHGVALVSVKALPSGMQLEQGVENELNASDSLVFEVEVENQGEATETDVKVRIELTAPGSPEPRTAEATIAEIAPGQIAAVEVTGLAAEAGGEPALLKVEAGPVPGEANSQNNVAEYSIRFI
jgi:hypothetical protein